MKKIKVPKKQPKCDMFHIIDSELLELLKQVEWHNEARLEQFWRMNTK